jgi:probable F420-dependent oxidoreductase
MLRLAARRSLGAHTYLVTPDHTRFARETVGDGPVLAVEQAFVLESDRTAAHAIARRHLAFYLERKAYRDNFLRLGFSEDDLAGEGSGRLVDALVVWGSAEAVRERVQAHLDAGADHVCVQPLGPEAADVRLDDLRMLAPALLELAGERA